MGSLPGSYNVIPLVSQPGIQRDGTQLSSKAYIDGQWCRFYMGRPRKIGGYKLIDIGSNEIARTLLTNLDGNNINVYQGKASSLIYSVFDMNGNGVSSAVDIIPDDYVADRLNTWSMDIFATTVASKSNSFLVANVAPNLEDIANPVNGDLYYVPSGQGIELRPVLTGYENKGQNEDRVTVSGGVVFSSPIMIAYGNDGFIRWSAPGRISQDDGGSEEAKAWPEENEITISNSKIVKMYPTRGSTTPQLLAWTLNSLINVSYVTSPELTMSATLIEDNISIMSPNSVVQYNQQFFWVGIDQFYSFNGVVQRLDNTMSTDWFFNNINLKMRNKVWGMAVPRFNEIWWFYPRMTPDDPNPQECNAVVIYNTELKVWYDSMISRAAGVTAGEFPYPLMSDSTKMSINVGRGHEKGYGLWMHEYETDSIVLNQKLAIPSWFETHLYNLFLTSPENNRLIRSRRIEPDFLISPGTSMSCRVSTRMFPQGDVVTSDHHQFNGRTEKIDDVNRQGRFTSYRFESNEVGGTYQMGTPLLNMNEGDVRP